MGVLALFPFHDLCMDRKNLPFRFDAEGKRLEWTTIFQLLKNYKTIRSFWATHKEIFIEEQGFLGFPKPN